MNRRAGKREKQRKIVSVTSLPPLCKALHRYGVAVRNNQSPPALCQRGLSFVLLPFALVIRHGATCRVCSVNSISVGASDCAV